MGQAEFNQILETAVNDAAVAARIAEGDFADLTDGELTGAEQALLSAAAGELDEEVVGFNKNEFLKLGDIKDSYTEIEWTYKPKLNEAISYGRINSAYIKFDG